MQTQPISVTRALVALNTLNNRIIKATNDSTFVAITFGTAEVTNFKPVSSLTQITDLISQRARTKSAIMKSNLTTIVVVAGISMTVMDAIDLKATIDYDKLLKQKLEKDLASLENALLRSDKQVAEATESALKALYSAGTKPTAEDIDTVTAPYVTRYKAIEVKVAGFDIREKIKELDNKINTFIADVDTALSESNAITQITI